MASHGCLLRVRGPAIDRACMFRYHPDIPDPRACSAQSPESRVSTGPPRCCPETGHRADIVAGKLRARGHSSAGQVAFPGAGPVSRFRIRIFSWGGALCISREQGWHGERDVARHSMLRKIRTNCPGGTLHLLSHHRTLARRQLTASSKNVSGRCLCSRPQTRGI